MEDEMPSVRGANRQRFRLLWPWYELQFRSTGVYARRTGTRSPFGLLLTPRQVRETLTLWKKEEEEKCRKKKFAAHVVGKRARSGR